MVEIFTERNNQKWGDILKICRIKTGSSQRAFGELLGVDNSTVARWEVGARKPTREIPFYEKIAGISQLTEQDIVQLLLTHNAPRWIHPEGGSALEAAQNFGGLLRFYRERTGISQRTFSGSYPEPFDESTIARVEQGIRLPPHDNQFYDRLPEILQLSPVEHARILLTGNPPRWMVPFLYEAVELDGTSSALVRTNIKRVGNTGLQISVSGYFGNITDKQISILQRLVEQALKCTLPNQ